MGFWMTRLRSLLFGGAPGVSRRDIVAAHEIMLGRPPESESALARYRHLPDRCRLGRAIMESDDFRLWLAGQSIEFVRGLRRAPVFLGDRVLAHTDRGYRIFLPPDDIDLVPSILETGRWETDVELALRALLKPGQVTADIGANVGCHSLIMADAVGAGGRVEAFEANPALVPLLRATIATNMLTGHVRVHAVAALEQPGTVMLTATPGHAGSGNIAIGDMSAAHAEAYPIAVEVPAVRIDDALAEYPALDLLRLDIEGSEPLALRGAEALIRRSPALRIVTEWSVPMMATRADVGSFVAWLTGLGFRFWRIERQGELEPLAPEATLGLGHCDLVLAREAP
jgi:FkbM family methyltransferase